MALSTSKRVAFSILAIPAAFIVLQGAENFYRHHNVVYETDEGRTMSKADGIMSHTEFQEGKDGSVRVHRFDPFMGSTFYTSNNGSQEVDVLHRISFGRGGHSQVLYRHKDLQNFPDRFKQADRDFREQIRRFKPLSK